MMELPAEALFWKITLAPPVALSILALPALLSSRNRMMLPSAVLAIVRSPVTVEELWKMTSPPPELSMNCGAPDAMKMPEPPPTEVRPISIRKPEVSIT